MTWEMAVNQVEDGWRRVVIEGVRPEVDGGQFAIKRTVGERVVVEADCFADGHEALAGVLLYRREVDSEWAEVALEPLVNDRWQAAFTVTEIGQYRYTLQAWVDPFKSWAQDLAKRVEAKQDVAVDLLIGADLVEAAGGGATGADARALHEYGLSLRHGGGKAVEQALSPELAELMARYPDREYATVYGKELPVTVDRERARFSAWYELFPRSYAAEPGRHGTFKDCEAHLPYVASMGFDVVYLPPIHPIGRTNRKGKNNSAVAGPRDPGSPWAIGGEEGGHKAIHPDLGTLEDFRRFVAKAREHGLEVALDLAYQCSPDHPYVQERPRWFRKRPDGTIQYAENPPKKYQDIYPFDFDIGDRQALWQELAGVVRFWIDQGVQIFRVDNPHTKPFAFWEWLIADVKREYPETIFLSEAFTRPKVMYRLAKIGFSLSYTYFAWRNTASELAAYLTELTQTEVREYFRPNLWPNTPDILTEYLQIGGRSAFMARIILAATLGASYGIYGPAFELGENVAVQPGMEEYLNSEKYEIKCWDLDRPGSLRELIGRVNRIRREHPALQYNRSLRFHPVDNSALLAYSKTSDALDNVILTVVNLDPNYTQSGWIELPLAELNIDPDQPFQMHDLLTGARYLWHGSRNYLELDPHSVPAHIFQVLRRVQTERDFDYFA